MVLVTWGQLSGLTTADSSPLLSFSWGLVTVLQAECRAGQAPAGAQQSQQGAGGKIRGLAAGRTAAEGSGGQGSRLRETGPAAASELCGGYLNPLFTTPSHAFPAITVTAGNSCRAGAGTLSLGLVNNCDSWLGLNGCFLCAKHCSKYFTSINSS